MEAKWFKTKVAAFSTAVTKPIVSLQGTEWFLILLPASMLIQNLLLAFSETKNITQEQANIPPSECKISLTAWKPVGITCLGQAKRD